jgi:tRNA (guanine-N(7)-)-methyltransferase subunit TRM82
VSRLQFFSQQQDFMLQVGDAERYFAGEWREDKSMEGILDNDPDERLKDQVDEKAVRDMLYNVENLRKRPGAED